MVLQADSSKLNFGAQKSQHSVWGPLAVGLTTWEVLEAAFRFCERGNPLMVIASQHQVNPYSGYVSSNEILGDTVQSWRNRTPSGGKLWLCRDHCGPKEGSNSPISEVLEAVHSDLMAGFDYIHIDYTNFTKNAQIAFDLGSGFITSR